MLICIDYDDTFTKDIHMWVQIIQMMNRNGHTVICATMRYREEGDEVRKHLSELVDTIYFTNRKAKKTYLAELGVHPDIWIDDTPEWLFQDG